MASYRPYPPPPQSSFPPPPNPNPVPAPARPPQQNPRAQFSQTWGFNGGSNDVPSNYNQIPQNSNFHHQPYNPPPAPSSHYSFPPPPPPPPESSYPPPPPPPLQNSINLQTPQQQQPQPQPQPQPQQQQQQPPMYYPSSSSQYNQYNPQSVASQPPPLPSSPPPSSSAPPPPPPPSSPPPPPPPQNRESGGSDRKLHGHKREREREHERERFNHHGSSAKQQRPPVPMVKKPNGNSGRVETEEERNLRKKREYEKQRQEEKHRQHLKESQNSILQKTQILASGKGHGSIVGSRMGEKRAAPLLSSERIENKLKKPTTFLCKLKFRNELPDPSAQLKLMSLKRDKDQYTKYTITSLEKQWKPKLYVEPDLGIPLDLLDLSVYNPPSVKPPLAPEDEELLRDDEVLTPVKKDGIRKKDRPTDKGVSWLVKTQYISPLSLESTKQSLTEKQAKELRELKGGRSILEDLNDRERQIKAIEASFASAKSRPVHATNKDLYPVEVLPLLPDFDRYNDQFVIASFDNAPTADSENYGKLEPSVRDEHESKAIMKSYVASGSDPAKPEKFLAYMVPSIDELSKDIFDEDEDIAYSWVREYNWDVRGDDADDPTTYLVSFDEHEARYVPLPTKLNLRKKRPREGRTNEEVEHFPVPASVTVRQRPTVAAIELKEPERYTNSKDDISSMKMRDMDNEDDLETPERDAQHQDIDQYSGAEDDISD